MTGPTFQGGGAGGRDPAHLPADLRSLYERFLGGQRLALARTISTVEDERPGFQSLLHALISKGLTSTRIGLTGPPGAGKSTLLAALATGWRTGGEKVGIVAVDPTSPFSGGALLGDRIRMNDIALDPGVFIRSMATRGSLGGLATTTKEVIDLMDAFGFGRILVETVGVGQTELEIAAATDTVVVVLVPESGDGIQAMKAGLMEIADVFVVNKADRPGADRLVKELQLALRLRSGQTLRNVPAHHGVDLSRVMAPREDSRREGESGVGAGSQRPGWTIPVLRTVAQSGDGLPELLEAIDEHRKYLAQSGEEVQRRRERAKIRVRDVVERELRRVAGRRIESKLASGEALDGILTGRATPYSVARSVLRDLLGDEAAEGLPW
jgi:LAO/AO transport system kinase